MKNQLSLTLMLLVFAATSCQWKSKAKQKQSDDFHQDILLMKGEKNFYLDDETYNWSLSLHYLEKDSALAFYTDNNKTVNVFDYRTGHLTGKIFTLDKKHELIYILDQYKILVYTYSGGFIREFSTEKFGGGFFSDILFIEDKLYLFEPIHDGHAKYDWVVIDPNGRSLSLKYNSVPSFKTIVSSIIKPYFCFNMNIYYWNQFNDTIFPVNHEHTPIKYLFAKGSFRLPRNGTPDFSSYFSPNNIIGLPHGLLIEYSYRNEKRMALYREKDNHFYELKLSKDQGSELEGIPNNLDGGPNIYPKEMLNDSTLAMWVDAYQLKVLVTSSALKDLQTKYPEKKKELKALVNGLNENDNPVLMLVKLK